MRLVYNSNSTMHLPGAHADPGRPRDRLGRRLPAGRAPPPVPRPRAIRRASLREALDGLGPVNLGALADVERWRPAERAAMLEEAEALTGSRSTSASRTSSC